MKHGFTRQLLGLLALLSLRAGSVWGQAPPRVAGPGNVNWDDRFGPPPAGLGLYAPILAITMLPNDEAYVGGSISGGVLRWTGTGWQSLGTGISGSVSAIVVMPNGDVVVGGSFNGSALASIARWDGSQWQALGTGLPGIVYTVSVAPNGDIVAGGMFTDIGGNPAADNLVRWDGTTWQPIGGGLSGTVMTVAYSANGDIVVGGYFGNAGGNPNADRVARWDGTQWQALGTGLGGTGAYVLDLRVMPTGDVLVGGSFSSAGGNSAIHNVARWDGSQWHSLGPALNGQVIALQLAANGDILAGGQFTDAGGNPNADRIARWNGTSWQSLGTGLDDLVDALAEASNGDVLAGGFFQTVGDGSKSVQRFGIYHTPTGVGLPDSSPTTPAFTLAPNPAHHSVRLTGATSPTATLLDGLGREVRTWPLGPGAVADLDLRGLPAGLYTVRAGAAVRRLVVE